MTFMRPLLAALLGLTFTVGCTNANIPAAGTGDGKTPVGGTGFLGGGNGAPNANGVLTQMPDLDENQTRRYLSVLAPMWVSRELTRVELEQIDERRQDAIKPILEGWTREPKFADAARLFIESKLFVSGTRDGINFNLPGNLASHMVQNELPLTTLLTADYCIGDNGQQTECDTGAPYAAGVLGTRAYLASRASRFNLTRSSTWMHSFACRGYPMEDTLEPRIDKTRLIPMFQAQTPDEQTEPNAAGGFGNGFACYGCHGQFAPHSQLFVRFDLSGLYRADATGIQDPAGELGRSTNGLFASHMKDPVQANDETSQMFGKQVSNLREAALVVAENDVFLECQSESLLNFGLQVDGSRSPPKEVVKQITDAAKDGGDATFGKLVVAIFNNPTIVMGVVSGTGGAQ